ncbi:MAG: ChrR family anti-sigma-E factor [Planktomarina sp.]
MSKIKHHLPEDLLMGYAAGVLPEAFNLVIATHLSLCDECRAAAAAYDTVGAAVMEDAGFEEMSAQSFAKTLDLIAQSDEENLQNASKPDAHGCGVLPAPLQDYVGGDLDAVKWRSIGMGVKQAILPSSKDASARLLFIPAGSVVPDHGHNGTELTLVLKGAFRDETDQFGPGDIEVANEDLHHMPIAELGEDCICLAATDAPLKFNSLLPRLAQPFLRI